MQGDFILAAVVSGALVVSTGAVYALLLALSKLNRSRVLLRAAFAAYAVLCVSTLVLGRALELDGFWSLVIIVMLIGYFFVILAIMVGLDYLSDSLLRG